MACWMYLGIDPGLRQIGWGVIAPDYRGSGVITVRKMRQGQQLHFIFQQVDALIVKWRPIVIAMEDLFIFRRQGLLRTAEALGVIALAAEVNGIPMKRFSPREVKRLVTRNGKATKASVARSVNYHLGTDLDVSDHETDALAVALALTHNRAC